jgi:hypothetical protein
MISEHATIHTSSPSLRVRASGARPSADLGDAVECPDIQSTGSRMWPWSISMAIALWRALAAWGNPSYFELERRAPEHRRLGPGVSRVSDSFWPLTDW